MTQTDQSIFYGFVTIVPIQSVGYCGGLLILNHLGRPLEFHCTLPVKPSKAQVILYGETLKPHLCGEVIAKALFEKSKTKPHLLITDCPDTASLSNTADQSIPAIALFQNPESAADQDEEVLQKFDELLIDWSAVEVAEQKLLFSEGDRSKWDQLRKLAEPFCRRNQLVEPFGRIRQAVAEAHQQAARRAA